MAPSLVDRLRARSEMLFQVEERGSPGRRALLRLGKLVWLTGRKIHQDLCLERAASLAFTTTASIIPLGILFLFLFGASRDFESVIAGAKRIVLDTFVARSVGPPALPDSSADGSAGATVAGDREVVGRFLDGFVVLLRSPFESETTQGAVKLGAILALLFTVSALFRSAERNFSVIWSADARRTLAQRLGVYWMMLTAPPLILILASLLKKSLGEPGLVTSLAGACISFFAFTLVFLYLPNARVHVNAAAAGALAAALGWEMALRGFGIYVHSAALTNIYGALGVIPFFLGFVYVTWTVALVGAELSYCVQHYPVLEREVRYHLSGQRVSRPLQALLILEDAYKGFAGQAPPPTPETLAAAACLPIAVIDELVQRLADTGYLVIGPEGVLSPTRAPERVQLLEVVQLFPPGTGIQVSGDAHSRSPLRNYLAKVGDHVDRDLEARTFHELLGETTA